MSDRILTERVRATALKMGMDLVGFGPVERWSNAPYLLSPPAILPEARTVVVCGFHITDTWTEMGGEPEPQEYTATVPGHGFTFEAQEVARCLRAGETTSPLVPPSATRDAADVLAGWRAAIDEGR